MKREVEKILGLVQKPARYTGGELNEVIKNKQFKGQIDNNKRVLSTQKFTAYLKISEGCNNRCTYCAIPLIRGGFHSFPLEDLVNQAKDLVNQGINELRT